MKVFSIDGSNNQGFSFAQVIIEKNQSGASSGSEAGTVSSMRILRTSTNVKRKFKLDNEH